MKGFKVADYISFSFSKLAWRNCIVRQHERKMQSNVDETHRRIDSKVRIGPDHFSQFEICRSRNCLSNFFQKRGSHICVGVLGC